jgi:hypothetical protein
MIRRLLAVGFALLGATPLAGMQGQDPEPVLVEMRLGRIAARTVAAYRVDQDVLIPLLAFFDLAELRSRREPDGTLTAIFQPGNSEFRVTPAGARLTVAGRERPLTNNEFLSRPDDLYLSATVIGSVLDLKWEINWSDLVVTVIDPEQLPLARRLRRERFAPGLLGGVAVTLADGQLKESRYPVEGLVADYSLLVPTDPGPKGGAYSLGVGLNLLGGSLESRVQNQGELSRDNLRFDLSWTGVWRDNRYLSQVRLGDGYASGPRTRSMIGVALGNVPFRRPSILGELPFSETLGPGWQIEAFRGGRLIAFDSVNALGQFSIDVPIQYGENPLDFIAYGPFGEVRQFSRTYRVLTNAIPARRLEYGISLGACRGTAPCEATGNADVRYGLSTRWTISGGVDQFWRDTLPDLSHPYLGLSGSLTNALAIDAEYVDNAVLRGSLRFEPSTNLRIEAEVSRFDTTMIAPILTPDGRRRQYTLFAQARPFQGRLRNWFTLDAAYDRIESRADRSQSIRLAASLQPNQIRFIPSLRWRRTTPNGGQSSSSELSYGMNLVALPIRSLGPVVGQLTSRAGIDFVSGGTLQSWSAFVSYPVVEHIRFELGGSWSKGAKTTLSLFLAADLPGVRAYTTVQRSPSDQWLGTQQVQGSLLYDGPYRKVAFNAGPSIQQSGVSGRVFLDLDDNGRMDRGEPVLPNVDVTVGIYSKRSNAKGEYRLWQLPAFDPVTATVDTTTLGSPLWVPAYSAIRIEPLPNRFTTLNIPILPGGMVEGMVIRESDQGDVVIPGAGLIFRHLKTGQTRDVTTFSDGMFYEMSIRPGEWEITVDPRVEARLGLRATPFRFTLTPRLQGESLSGIIIRLR